MSADLDDRTLTPRARRALRWLLVVAGVVAWSYALFGSEGLLRQWQALRELNHLEAELRQAREDNAELAGEIERLKTDPLTIERHVRTQLDFQRPGETVFILDPAPGKVGEPQRAGKPPFDSHVKRR